MSARTSGSSTRGGTLLLAGLLIVGGIVLLLLNLNLLDRWEPVAHYVVAGSLALGGVAFFASAQASKSWQRIIPAWTLLALAVMVLLGERENPNTRLVAATLFWGSGGGLLSHPVTGAARALVGDDPGRLHAGAGHL